MKAGRLRHRITIQVQTSSQDDWGEQEPGWSDVITNVPAAIESVSGREFFAAQQVQADVNTRITIRYHAGIAPTMRVVHQTNAQADLSPPERTLYDIEAVLPDPTGLRQLILMCRLRSNEGFRSGT